MFVYEGLVKLKKISEVKADKKLDYTYFKRSSDVNETMKPPKQVDEFIEILQKQDFGHRVTFTENEKQKATAFFTYVNYYRFSIFPRLIKSDTSRTFTNLIYLYNTDKYIRDRLGHFSGILEEWVKTSLVSVISSGYSSQYYQKAEFYLDLDIYTNKSWGKETLVSFADTVIRSKEPYIKYHHKQKQGCIPIWVLVEELTFGQIDTFLSQLKSEYKNMWIDAVFGKEYRKFVISWIGVARYVRNMSAHYARFYSKRFVVFPSLPKEDLKAYNIKNSHKDNLFVMLFTEKKLLSFFPDRAIIDEWNKFISELSEIVEDSNGLFDLNENGFPSNWVVALTI